MGLTGISEEVMRGGKVVGGQVAMVTKVVYAVEGGPVKLHFLVRPLASFLASWWMLTPANGQDNIRELYQA